MAKLVSNATVVIRTVGERTTDLCHQILQEQVDKKNIFIINLVPFSKAVRETFRIGLNNELPWTIAVDADVLVKNNGIKILLEEAEKYQDPFFKGNAKVVDKFLGSARFLPPHIYTTEFLNQALEALPVNYGLRPETEVCELMDKKLRTRHAYFSEVIAIHDYEQYFKDIYRKSFVFGYKHPKRINHYITYWPSQIHKDKDFLVALAGLFKALYSENEIQIDVRKLPMDYKEVDFLSNLEEKKDLSLNFNKYFIEKTVQRYIFTRFLKKIWNRIFRKLNVFKL